MARRENRLRNRLRAFMIHTSRYAFLGAARLAADAGISKSALSRLISGKSSPSYEVVAALTAAVEKNLHRPIDPRDLVALDGRYPTRFVCDAAGCRGCLPDQAYDPEGNRRQEFLHLRPGEWTGAEFARKEAA
jgi:transcriptional regulator with XRE-family HTH domain